jgi:hypothetical protein
MEAFATPPGPRSPTPSLATITETYPGPFRRAEAMERRRSFSLDDTPLAELRDDRDHLG